MLTVALMLTSARLSVLDRWLRTRWRVAVIGGALALIWVGLMGLTGNLSQARYAILGNIVAVALVDAMMLVAMPSRARRQEV